MLKSNMIYYPYSNSELLFWQNIAENNYNPDIIRENTEIKNYLAMYDRLYFITFLKILRYSDKIWKVLDLINDGKVDIRGESVTSPNFA